MALKTERERGTDRETERENHKSTDNVIFQVADNEENQSFSRSLWFCDSIQCTLLILINRVFTASWKSRRHERLPCEGTAAIQKLRRYERRQHEGVDAVETSRRYKGRQCEGRNALYSEMPWERYPNETYVYFFLHEE